MASLALRLHNSLTRKVEAVDPATPGKVRVYWCGPTTYDVIHAGNARTFSSADLLVRHLRASGAEVTYVRNITDVDDKILARAKERGEDPLALSARFGAIFHEDMGALGCVRPDAEPKVSETMARIVTVIEKLVEKRAAYVVDGTVKGVGQDVWYGVRSFPTYGKLSGRTLDDLRSGEGLEERGKIAHEGKRDPLDFALWKAAPEGEWGFASPWGNGRPGWHIECSAMVDEHLGYGIEIHGGGMDLIFPHHENEIAQSEAALGDGTPFSKMWIHCGFLNVDMEKMAKSLGNFVTLRDCLERNDAEAVRYFYLTAHYRGPMEFDTLKLPSGRVVFPALDEAEMRVDYLYATRERLEILAKEASAGDDVKDLAALAAVIRGARAKVATALDDDLNSPVALAVVNELAKAANDLCDLAQKRRKDPKLVAASGRLAADALTALLSSCDVIGLLQSEGAKYAERTRQQRMRVRGLDPATIETKVGERRAARDAKDFARSDAIRAELLEQGVEIADGPTGTTWRVGVQRARET